jgi:hypothetical protein
LVFLFCRPEFALLPRCLPFDYFFSKNYQNYGDRKNEMSLKPKCQSLTTYLQLKPVFYSVGIKNSWKRAEVPFSRQLDMRFLITWGETFFRALGLSRLPMFLGLAPFYFKMIFQRCNNARMICPDQR